MKIDTTKHTNTIRKIQAGSQKKKKSVSFEKVHLAETIGWDYLQSLSDNKSLYKKIKTKAIQKKQSPVQEIINELSNINFVNHKKLNALHYLIPHWIFHYEKASKKEIKKFKTNLAELIKNGADINATDKKGDTILHYASFWGNFEIVKILLKHGAKIMIKNKDGDTPLDYAKQLNHKKMIELLINSAKHKDR